MALNATVGGADTNSYVTLNEAASYFESRAHAEAWEDEDEQDKVLVTASQAIDWYTSWKGQRVNGTQAMCWPRVGVLNKVGELYSESVVPKDVKTAVYEMALASLESDRMADGDLDGLSKVKAGSLLIETDDNMYNKKPNAIPEHVVKILSALATNSGIGVVRLVRA